MTDKEALEVSSFSKLVIPPCWSPLLAKDVSALEFIGFENLRLLLDFWKVTQRAFSLALETWPELDERTGFGNPRAKYHREMIARAKKRDPDYSESYQ